MQTAIANKEEFRQNIVGLSKPELSTLMKESALESFRAKQIWSWVYRKGKTEFQHMHNLKKEMQEKCSGLFSIDRPEIVEELKSVDGTMKWLLKLHDGHLIEMVYIPETNRGTLCISSQVGCTLTCKFCHTGTQRWVRNLEPHEIVSQFLLAKDRVQDWSDKPHDRKITNIVMMGMGEPLFNYENVAKGLKVIMDEDGIALSKKRITLSTSGVVPLIRKCGEELGVKLAVSLHAVTNDLRDKIVPLNKKYPIEELLDACRNYPATRNARRITFEYVMLKGVNDSDQDAKQLVKLIKDIPAKVNLIPFNPWPGTFFECSDEKRIDQFAKILMDAGYVSPIRTPRGQDIFAACGQLKTKSERKRKSACND